MRVDVSKWTHRNIWPLSSGELAVRPAVQSLYSPTDRLLVAGFSVPNPRTGVVWHYSVDTDEDGQDAKLTVLDDDFVVIQSIGLTTSGTPRVVTWGLVEDQMVVTSPDFPTYWGVVGSGLVLAEKGTSAITGRITLDVPRGICVGWAGRTVIAGPDAMYISDPLSPLVFDPINILNPPGGAIYGMHVTLSGSLTICTTDGVYSLSVDAAAGGQLVLGVWQKLTDHATVAYGTTGQSRGILFGLTQKGYRKIGQEGSEEVRLDDPRYGFTRTDDGFRPAVFPDYRRGRLFSGQFGPVISIENMLHLTDLESGLNTWWESTDAEEPFACAGLMTEPDGTELFVLQTGVSRPYGTTDDDEVIGALFGRVQVSPDNNLVVRWVDFASDSVSIGVAVNAELKTAASAQVAPVLGTDEWDEAGVVWRQAAFRSKRFNFAQRTDNIVVEVRALGSYARLDRFVSVDFAGPGKKRRT